MATSPDNQSENSGVTARRSNTTDPLVVGLGASQGGVESVLKFFQHLPPESGIVWIVMLNLPSDSSRQLAEQLPALIEIPVMWVTGKACIESDHIFIVPADRHFSVHEGEIKLSQKIDFAERRAPIDIFFRTLGEAFGPRSVAVILSGTGANGCMGLKTIKEKGGAAFVQNPNEAECNEMPRHAIARGLPDGVYDLAELPARILDYKNRLETPKLPETEEGQAQLIREICSTIRLFSGHDFSNYKQPVLLRQLERRMTILGVRDLSEYAAFLKQNNDEAKALEKNLLVSVTNFFRDKKAFEVIETEVIPQLIRNRINEKYLRIWVAGCATGEEAYSLAMLFTEQTAGMGEDFKLQIFATDIDEDALAKARKGSYTINELADVSSERLTRFFTRAGEQYSIRNEVRDKVLFATHNFLTDPPFLHLDLISCRNVMIYLNQHAQQRLIETFHFALRVQGFLFLGAPESVDGARYIFSSYHRGSAIYQSNPVSLTAYPIPQSVPRVKIDRTQVEITKTTEHKAAQFIPFGDLHSENITQKKESTEQILQLKEEVARNATDKYLRLFNSMEEGFVVFDVMRNSNDEVVNLKCLEVNPAFEKQMGISEAHVSGKTLMELFPDLYQSWIQTLQKVIKHNRPEKIEQFIKENGQWYELFSYPLPSNQLAVLFNNISLRKKAELALKESDSRKAFLLKLHDALRPLSDPLEIQKATMQIVGEAIGADRLLYADVLDDGGTVIITENYTSNDIRKMVGIFKTREFGGMAVERLKSGETLNIPDIMHAQELTDLEKNAFLSNGIRSILTVSLVKNGQWVSNLAAHSLSPREWTDYELAVLNEAAERSWAAVERAKAESALRESEEKYRTLFDSMDEGYCIIQMIYNRSDQPVDWLFLEVNRAFELNNGLRNAEGKTIRELAPDIEPKWMEIYSGVARSGRSLRFEEESLALGRIFSLYAFRIEPAEHHKVAVIFTDITQRKLAEQELRDSEERKNFLLTLDDALRPLNDPSQIQDQACRIIADYLQVDCVFYAELTDNNSLVSGDIENDKMINESAREAFLSMQVAAAVSIPVVNAGEPFSKLNIHHSRPRPWTHNEILTIQDAAERIWARVQKAITEQTLRRSEAKFRRLSDSGIVSIAFFDTQGYIFDANDAFLEMLGITRQYLNSNKLKWDTYTPAEWMPRTREAIEEFKATGYIAPYEKQFRHSSGELHWGLFTGATMEDGETSVSLVIETTKRKKAEQALQASENRLRDLADAVPQVIWANDANGRANYFNQRWYNYTGLSYQQSVDRGWIAIVHPADAPASIEKWMKALAIGEVFDTEYRLKGHDGNYRWFIGRNVPLKDEAGNVTGWFGTATDIDDLKRAGENLAQSEARLRIAMDGATDYGIITTDNERRIERWSQGAAHIFGYTESEVLGKSLDLIFTDEDKAADVPQKEMETARDTGRAIDERWHQRKDGSRFYVSGVMRPIYHKELTGYVKILRDMTHQQLFTEELHRLVAERTVELQRSNEDLRQFAHVASHDLKEPVRKIQIFNSRILDEHGANLPPKVKSYSEKIRSAAERMYNMIEGVLRYSKMDSEKPTNESVDLNETIKYIVNDLEVLMAQKKASVTVDNLPVIQANPTLVYQLFYNLVLNSLKFARKEEDSRIMISAEDVQQNGKDLIQIRFADNGIGFDPKFGEHIFKTFTRLHTREEYEGSGLGLALCRKIVERFGGSISATAEPGKGATFTIILPGSPES